MSTVRRYTAGSMPGTNGFTIACFEAKDVPVGSRIYTESCVAGLVEAMKQIVATCELHCTSAESMVNQIDIIALKALSKFRGEDA